MAWLRQYLVALQFFTRVPVTGRLADWIGFSPALLHASAAHLPGVGLLVGALTGAVAALLLHLLAPAPLAGVVAAVFCVAAGVLLTGALHEDGLADTADGLGGGQDRVQALRIMKDPRIGSYGALALVLTLSARIALLALIAGGGTLALCGALLAGHVLSRLAALVLARSLPYVGDPASSRAGAMTAGLRGGDLWVALAWSAAGCAAAAALLGPGPLLAAAGAAALALAWLARLFRRRLQGITGDGLGATQQACECACYLGIALAA